jgi:hypothetical protein
MQTADQLLAVYFTTCSPRRLFAAHDVHRTEARIGYRPTTMHIGAYHITVTLHAVINACVPMLLAFYSSF